MSYIIAAISNGGGASEKAYRKMQEAGACPEKPFAGKKENNSFYGHLDIFSEGTIRYLHHICQDERA